MRLLRLVRAQHRQDETRARLARGTTAWDDATTSLETLNDQVFNLASTGILPTESLGYDLDLELDSRPEEDLAFHDSVVECVRQVVRARVIDRRAARSAEPRRASQALVRATAALLELVRASLRRQYPAASFAVSASSRTTIKLIAERERSRLGGTP